MAEDFLAQIQQYWNENQEWLTPAIITNAIIIFLGVFLAVITGGNAPLYLLIIVIVAICAAPFLGYFAGEYIDDAIGPQVDELVDKVKEGYNDANNKIVSFLK